MTNKAYTGKVDFGFVYFTFIIPITAKIAFGSSFINLCF